jgi:hypothetical protein
MNMTEQQKAERLRQLFSVLASILQREQEINWIRAIHLILDKLNNPDNLNGQKLDTTLEYVRDTYQSINKGMGSFSDFHIWRDNFKERQQANRVLDEILNEIWTLLS